MARKCSRRGRKGGSMTDPKTRQAIKKMREDGASFAEIANFFSLSPNTVKSICYRSNTQTLSAPMQKSGLCRNCGRLLSPSANAGKKIFCCNQCRYDWWNRLRSRQPYRLTCYYCGKEFISFGNRKKKFCGRECYRLSRYGRDVP